MIRGSFPQHNQSAFISFISVISGKGFWLRLRYAVFPWQVFSNIGLGS